MIFRDLFKKTYEIVKYNLVLVQPLLIFMFLAGVFFEKLAQVFVFNAAGIIFVFVFFEMLCAFLAGWFNMINKSIELFFTPVKNKTEKSSNSLKLFAEFMPGVGKHFFRVNITFILYILLFFALMHISSLIGSHFIGEFESVSRQDMLSFIVNADKAAEILTKLSLADKIRIVKWDLFALFISGIFSYLTMFLAPAVISARKSPLKAFLLSVKTVFKRPFTTFAMLLIFWISSFVVSIISALGIANFIIQLIGLIILVYSLVYFNVMIFLYFEKYSENNSNSGSNSIG